MFAFDFDKYSLFSVARNFNVSWKL